MWHIFTIISEYLIWKLSLEYMNNCYSLCSMHGVSGRQRVWLRLDQQIGISTSMGIVEYSVPDLHQQEVLSKLGHLQALAVGKKVMVKYQVHPAVDLLLSTDHP
jgi:hypothetical protein